MKRALILIGILGAGLLLALVLRVWHLRAAAHGPAGGSGVIEGVDVNVTSRIAARITKVNVREGDMVKPGDVLVELDCIDQDAALGQAKAQLAAAQENLQGAVANASSASQNASGASENVSAAKSQVEVLKAQEELARVDLARTEELVKSGTLSQSALDEARSKDTALLSQVAGQGDIHSMNRNQAGALWASGKGAKSQVAAARDSITDATAGVARAALSVSECKLLAPRTAMVVTRNLEPGEAVQSGTNVLALTDVTEARTRFYLPNAELAAAAPGRKARVVADAYPGQAFEGTIFYVSPRAEFTPRNVQTREDRERLVYAVEVRIPNADMRLRSGMPVEVAIEGSWQ
ncbi:MAG: HlyD family efflux transporter periplasmic adaptor subunit [Polyangiaceae bacterium]|jgi:HlyD family secretion protein